jgi:hypothetical protein
MQDLDVPAVADRDHPAVRTAGQIGVGLDVQHHKTLSTANVGIAGDVEDVHASTPNNSSVRAHHDEPGPHVQ